MFTKHPFFKKTFINNLSLIIVIFPILALVFYGGFVSIFLVTKQHSYLNKEIENFEDNIIEEQKKLLKDKAKNIKSFVEFSEKKSYDRVKKEIKMVVNMAYDTMQNIYQKNQYTKNPQEIKNIIKFSLEKIRFNRNRGYLFINDINGTVIMHPFNTNLEGENLINIVDANGKAFFKEFSNIIKNNSQGYIEYSLFKPEFGLYEQYKKISYVKEFPIFNWYIGAGEYFYDIQEDIKNDILTFLESIKLYESGFIFIFDNNGKLIKHPCAKEFLNINDEEVRNSSNEILSTFKTATKEQKFVYYDGKDCLSGLSVQKIAYIYHIENYNWYIVISKNLKEINEIVEEQKNNITQKFESEFYLNMKLLLAISVISFLLSFYLSKIINQTLQDYEKEIKNNQKILTYQSRLAQAGELLSMIAHQWRQPLSKIAAVTSSLRFDILTKQKNNELLDKKLEKIETYTEYLSQTIDDFKNFYKPIKEKQETFITPLIEKTIDFLENSITKKAIRISKNFIEDEKLTLYPNELIQVFINLIQNAIDVSSKKGVIYISFKSTNNIFIINIEDEGGGISSENINKIFDPYFTTKIKNNNLGLGLYMSKIIIEKHLNSKIEVKNSQKGAIFTIKIKK